MTSICCVAAVAAAGLAACGVARADDPQAQALGRMSLDELAQIRVTSVSKRPEPMKEAASSIYVITGEQLQRSGAMSIPEALSQAPNLEVARIDALDYSITARGFGGFESANKLLVLIDGRSVYTPLFSGVDWDQHQVLLDDVDRIEVISGPSGALWGANAVNGVVNITTRSAFETQGWLAGANVGTLDSDVRLRYGRPLGDSAAGRVYLTAFRRGDLRLADGTKAKDGWRSIQGGFRADWAGDRDTLTLQGDAHDGDIDQSLTLPGYVRGGNLLGRWTRRTAGGQVEVQAYYDQIEREARLVHDAVRTWDVQAQQSLSLGGRHNLVWGAGYRITHDEFRVLVEPQLLSPPRRRIGIGNVFAQDQIALSDRLTLTAGLKVETNTYTKAEPMPNIRLGWQVTDRQFLWTAISRAIRNPSRIERDFTFPGITIPGQMGSEKLVAYELGYRGRVGPSAAVSATLYYDDYDDIRSNDLINPGTFPGYVGNSLRGRVWGIEAWGDYDIRPWWRLSLGGAALRKDFDVKPGRNDISGFEAAGVDPKGWIKARSQMRLSDRLSLDLSLRAYAKTPNSAASNYLGAPAYAEAGARLAWRLRDDLELSITGDNLLHDSHPEASEARRTEPPRSVMVGLRWTR